jgi:flagellar FliL protein
MILMIVAAVLLIIGSVAGGYFFMTKGGEAEHGSEEHKVDAEPKEVAEPDVYYALPNPLIVDFPAGSSAKIIKISLTILIKGEANVAVLKKHEPMIRNNLLMAISAIGADKAKTTEGKEELRASMLTEIGKVLEKMAGKNTATDVYFTEFVMQ